MCKSFVESISGGGGDCYRYDLSFTKLLHTPRCVLRGGRFFFGILFAPYVSSPARPAVCPARLCLDEKKKEAVRSIKDIRFE